MSGLTLKNINKTFPADQQAIRDFNLEVKDREFLILVGPTACGKSTLLRMIGGLEEITSGSLMIDGMDMTDADPKEIRVPEKQHLPMPFPHPQVCRSMR